MNNALKNQSRGEHAYLLANVDSVTTHLGSDGTRFKPLTHPRVHSIIPGPSFVSKTDEFFYTSRRLLCLSPKPCHKNKTYYNLSVNSQNVKEFNAGHSVLVVNFHSKRMVCLWIIQSNKVNIVITIIVTHFRCFAQNHVVLHLLLIKRVEIHSFTFFIEY